MFYYKLNNHDLTRVSIIKHLSIYFKSGLSFKFYHKTILIKYYKILGFIIRNTQNLKNHPL